MIYHKVNVSPSRRLKNLFKPVMKRIFITKTAKDEKRSSYIRCEYKESDFEWLSNEMANEHLENRLIEEVQHSHQGDAIIAYHEDGEGQLEFVDKDEFYLPIHFARTNASTFFWTSLQRETIEAYNIKWYFFDRWAQA